METEATTPSSPFTDFTRRTFLGVIFTALVTAILTLLIAKALSHFVISPALCRGASQAVCQSSTEISFHIASLIAAIVGVAMLVNLSVYRPLLVMVAVVMGSWEVYATTSPLFALTWWWQLGVIFVVTLLALLAFWWILRTYNLVVAIILTVLLIAAMVAALLITF